MYIQSVVGELRRLGMDGIGEMLTMWMGHIASLYWEYLETCKEWNLITIYNFDKELMAIYRGIGDSFAGIPGLPEGFKGLGQFYALMLVNNVNDILEKNKRDISYSHLDISKILPILKKYNKAKTNL